jgi:hypothetical protein
MPGLIQHKNKANLGKLKRVDMKKSVYLSLLFLSVMQIQTSFGQTSRYYWNKDAQSVALMKETPGKANFMLWRLNLDPAKKPFFHPICSPDGTLLTAQAPSDHLWHLGQWFCWKYINKLNYWEYAGDPEKAVSEGRTHVIKTRIRTHGNGGARIELGIAYHPWDQQDSVVMKENRTITVSAPEPDGSYRILYDMIFTAVKDVILDRTPPQTSPGGVSWGGYAGLSMRFDQKLTNPVYFSETRDSVINGEGNAYVAANLTSTNGRTVQMVILDHPENPRYPSAWYTINRPNDRFWFFSPALLYHSAMEMKAGDVMRLRYTILVPATPLGREEIKRLKAQGARLK